MAPTALNRRDFLVAGAAVAGAALHPFSAKATERQAHLRIMETTDLHVNVFPYDYYADKETPTVGLARTATIIDQIRAEATNTLLFDNGDFLQGNPMGDYVAFQKGMKRGDAHPVIAAMNVLGYDAGTLGNHEFNYGLDFLANVIAPANFPIVSANLAKGALVADPASDERIVPPHVILDREIALGDGSRQPIRIGVIGFLPPQITVWDAQNLAGKASTRGIVETARALVPRLRAQGAQIVVALSHSGIAAGSADDAGLENASLQLAAVEGIDVVLTGHQHLRFPGEDFAGIENVDAVAGTLHGKPAVMAGFWGSDLGLVDLLLERRGEGWAIVSATNELRPIFERVDRTPRALVESKPEVLAAAKADHEATLTYVRTPVGETTAPLYSYFALVADDPSVQIVNQAQLRYMKEILKGTPLAALPLLSAAAPFKSGGRSGPDYYTDIPAGPIAIRNVADLYLYPNTVQAVKVTGAGVKDWLEMSAGIFQQVEAGGSDQPLIADGFPSYNFDVIDGVTYRIDVTKPARFDRDGKLMDEGSSRIVDLAFGGEPIDPAQEFVVVTNNYRAGGGGKFPGIGPDKIVFVAPDANRDVLIRYIVENPRIDPAADGNWRLAPVPDTTVLFSTGPASAAHLQDIAALKPESAGRTDDGYARYRLHL
ncbi:bifunctional 2',3'-cyclic-nucleotide 2'-phosphodiesterase/3'-nucleotidase [Aureimonas pseudogalii]|uniref:2',3'-cyclic-nucleotide 2'-phosphodiesterase/3'-nucleotidase n=1 Tax=Aureimonas pseudogalii TaxID=1744844 RepID=A0A7W6H5T6_9HYPH|nr:bifunctional 2',3'-cyclic-nucleotide 2'-phosphodiesterase/3'-nucleotidase [Aureimonas pseudogalii]MBB3999107.1 2',3'-cyclic-nucleotide 2'-phosphodiesterase/3'-nucleotidase [Aureimonas pseudogalii]